MRNLRVVVFLLVGFALLVAAPGVQAQPPADWWLVLHEQCADVLHWVNETGAYASMARPHLPNEAASAACMARSLHISPDGRYLVQAALLNDGTSGIGFYDLDTGQWIAVQPTGAEEFAMLGDRYSSTPDNQIAIGFANSRSADNGWRVAIYDMTTGTLVDELRSDGTEIASFVGGEFLATELTIPYVSLLRADATGALAVDIRFQAFDLGAEPFGAVTWYPAGAPGVTQELVSAPYTALDMDLLPDGRAIYAYEDPGFAAGPPVGMAPATIESNAIAVLQPDAANPFPAPQVFYADNVSTVYWPQWASDGRIMLFHRNDGTTAEISWIAAGTPVLVPLEQQAGQILGVPTGFVYGAADSLYFLDEASAQSVGPIMTHPMLTGSAAFVWATGFGETPFAFTTITDHAGAAPSSTMPLIVTATPRPAEAFPTAQPPQPTVDTSATGPCRVRSEDGSNVNVRSGPDIVYPVLGQLLSTTEAPVIGYNGSWYVINFSGSQGWVASWVVNTLGNCTGLPVMVAPPTPAATADPATAEPPSGAAVINFYVSSNDGTCADIRWQVENVQAVYFEGAGVAGTGSEIVCPPPGDTIYTLTVVHLDSSSENRTLTVNIPAPGPTATWTLPAPPEPLFPDLFVSEFSLDPNPPVQNQPVNVQVGVYNQGNTPASGSFRVQWYGGENFANPSCEWNRSDLVANGGFILTCTFTYNSWYGNINTKVIVDSNNSISESDESNNTYLQNISVSQP